MPSLSNQKIVVSLFGDGVESSKVVRSDIWVPDHTHDHQSLSNRRDPLAHPQYLTEEQAASLFSSLLTQYIQAGQVGTIKNGQNIGTGLGVFASTSNGTMQFYTLEAGDNVTLQQVGNSIVINSTGGGGGSPVAFTFDSLNATPTITPAWTINPVNGSLIEVGGVLSNLNVTAVFSSAPDSTSFTDPASVVWVPETDLGAALAISMNFDYAETAFTFPAIGTTRTYTMAAIKNASPSTPATRSKSYQSGARVYYGVGNPGTIPDWPSYTATPFPNFHTACTSFCAWTGLEQTAVESHILGWSSSIQTSKAIQFTVTAAAGEKIYFAYPTSFGATANFLVDAFPDGFFKVADDIAVINQFGVSINYTLYESDIAGLGTALVQVT